MTPQEKAIELVDKMGFSTMHTIDNTSGQSTSIYKNQYAKQCALIAVDEILENFGTLTEGKQHYAAHCTIQFYEQVKQEIEKL
jgi:hypothetical protein